MNNNQNDEAACMIPGVRPRRTPQDILSYWRIKIERERRDQESCLKHGMSDQSKWHEGIADAGSQFADELEHLILPLLKPKPPTEAQPQVSKSIQCITRIGYGPNNLPFVIYLRDGIKITVGRGHSTSGPAWLKVSDQLTIKAQ